MDCNVGLARVRDKDLVGTAVVGRIGERTREKMARPSCRIHEGSLLACNTWQNAEHEELMYTRHAWDGGPAGQIDFNLASKR